MCYNSFATNLTPYYMRTARFIAAILCLFIATSTVQAQKADLLVGKWVFQDIYNNGKTDTSGFDMARKMFAGLAIQFNKNNYYKAFIFNSEDAGKWSINEATSTVTLSSSKGNVDDIKVIELAQNKLIISMGKPSFILTRTAVDDKDTAAPATVAIPLASATTTQIAKKWFFKKMDAPGKTEQRLKMLNMMAKGTYIDLKPAGDYSLQVLNITENGKWAFGDGNTSIILTADGEKKIWRIKSISPHELILLKGDTEESWTYGDAE